MAGRIPENILEEILSRIDIVELIAGYIPLKRAGRNFRALCPFHQEKTPSFMVSPDRQIYHCFGCGLGGNAFNFIIRYERMEFLEAVEVLAKKAGVILPKAAAQDSQVTGLITQLYKINELATQYYENILNSAQGLAARQYLLKRGVKEETQKVFKLGYAPDRWDGLLNYLRQKNQTLSLLEKAGLVLENQGGTYCDRFRRRIIVPICDIKSRPIAFGGRVFPERDLDTAKYINSPETPIYIKGRNLYGLNLAKDQIRQSDCAVIVEGYLDFIIPYQEGLRNLVASAGTAFTAEQARLLRRYTYNVVMVYDADAAGQTATLRSLDLFIEEGINVKVVSLPQGFDPDLYLRRNGSENFKKLLASASNLFDYKLGVLKLRHNCRDPQGKAAISAEMLPSISKFKNAVLEAEYVKKLAEILQTKEDALWQELKKIKGQRPAFNLHPEAVPKTAGISPAEKMLIRLMLEEKELLEHFRQHIEPADFQDTRLSQVVSTMFDFLSQGKNIELKSLLNHVEDKEVLGCLCESAFLSDLSPEDKNRVAQECIARLKNQKIKTQRQHLHEQIKLAQSIGDEEKVQRLIQEFHSLIKKR